MRTLRIIGMAVIAVIMSVNFTACGDDDDFNTDDLVGLWEGESSYILEKEDGEVVYDDSEELSQRFKLNSDGTAISYYKSGSSWMVEGEGTWSYKDGKLYTQVDGEEDYVTILELNPQKLVVEMYDSETEDGVKYEYYEKDTYKKVTE